MFFYIELAPLPFFFFFQLIPGSGILLTVKCAVRLHVLLFSTAVASNTQNNKSFRNALQQKLNASVAYDYAVITSECFWHSNTNRMRYLQHYVATKLQPMLKGEMTRWTWPYVTISEFAQFIHHYSWNVNTARNQARAFSTLLHIKLQPTSKNHGLSCRLRPRNWKQSLHYTLLPHYFETFSPCFTSDNLQYFV